MAGKRRTLSPAQQIATANAKKAYTDYKNGKAETEARIRAEVKEANDALEMTAALAIRRANELGVPKSTIGVEALSTADPGTVRRWLAKTQRLVMNLSVGESPAGVFAWADPDHTIVSVNYEAFPTSIIDSTYPATLQGKAKLAPGTATGWAVAYDPGSEETDLGVLKGWFSVEIEDIPTSQEFSLTSMLNEWVGANR